MSETSSQPKDSDGKETGEEVEDEQENVRVAGSKTEPILRRQELVALAETLVCVENAEEFLKSNVGKEVIYEVAMGGAAGVLCPSLSDKLRELYDGIASVATKPKSQEPETNSEHVMEDLHSEP